MELASSVQCYLFIVYNMAGVDESPVIEDVIETVEKVIENNADSNVQLERTERLLKLPLSRIKTIMKTDSDVTIASLDAAVLIAKATVSFRLVKPQTGSDLWTFRVRSFVSSSPGRFAPRCFAPS